MVSAISGNFDMSIPFRRAKRRGWRFAVALPVTHRKVAQFEEPLVYGGGGDSLHLTSEQGRAGEFQATESQITAGWGTKVLVPYMVQGAQWHADLLRNGEDTRQRIIIHQAIELTDDFLMPKLSLFSVCHVLSPKYSHPLYAVG